MKLIKKVPFGSLATALSAVLSLHLLFNAALEAAPPEYSPPTEHVEHYFAYGSNMSPQYLARIRGLHSQWSAAAQLEDHEVRFSLEGIPNVEPSFATVTPAPGKIAYGVLHRLSPEDVYRIKQSEGDSYQWQQVQVVVQGEEPISAWTLVTSPASASDQLPSRRYLKTMYDAAVLFGFSEEELQRLDPKQGAYFPILSETVGTVIQTAVWISARSGAFRSRRETQDVYALPMRSDS